MKKIAKNIWAWLFLVLLTAGLLTILGNNDKSTEKLSLAPGKYKEAKYLLSQYARVEIEGGIVRVSAPLTGTIKSVFVRKGDLVKKDQLLAIQESRKELISVQLAKFAVDRQRLNRRRAQINLKTATRNLKRLEEQVKQDAVSQQKVDNQKDVFLRSEIDVQLSENTFRRAEMELEIAENKLSQTKILSPVAGVILRVSVTEGTGVSIENASTAFTIIPNKTKFLKAKVSEQGIDEIYIGQTVDIRVNYRTSEAIEGVVTQIGSVFSSPKGRTASNNNSVDVKIEAENIEYRLGRTLLVQFQRGQEVEK